MEELQEMTMSRSADLQLQDLNLWLPTRKTLSMEIVSWRRRFLTVEDITNATNDLKVIPQASFT
jgi:hypothetical protein